MKVAGFWTVWANMGEPETELLCDAHAAAEKLLNHLTDRSAGPYAQHLALEVESRLRALLRCSPHIEENFR